jgi:membrane protease YdiL (CAAX protease family)
VRGGFVDRVTVLGRGEPDDPGRSTVGFVGLTFGLSTPFWALGAATGASAGGLPIASAMVVCPAGAASILAYRRGGRRGLARLWRRVVDRSGLTRPGWLAAATAAVPAAVVATAAVERLLGRLPVDGSTPWATVPLALGVFAVAAVAEEVGWSGFATDALQRRLAPVGSGVVLGVIWAVWHYVPLVQAGRSITWIAWWTLFTVAQRVILVLLYNGAGGSVPITVVGHAAANVAAISFGDFFDPRITGIVLAAEAVAAVALTRRR